MRGPGPILLALAVVAPVGSIDARTLRAPRESWGKAGIGIEQYRADSLECARRGYTSDLADTPQAKILRDASRRIDERIRTASDDLVNSAIDVRREVERVQPQNRIAELREVMLATVGTCLAEHGYRRFRLTDAQRKHVSQLPIGSDARRTYLHGLASDPAVLDAQAI